MIIEINEDLVKDIDAGIERAVRDGLPMDADLLRRAKEEIRVQHNALVTIEKGVELLLGLLERIVLNGGQISETVNGGVQHG